jgi:acetyl esterase/lipase
VGSRQQAPRRRNAGALLLACGLVLAARSAHPQFLTPPDVLRLKSKPADHRRAYGQGALQFGELRLPRGAGPHPVVILIHGGCWVKSYADLRYTSPLADALRDAGFATWNVEYRGIDEEGGGWPGTFNDVANATDFVRVLASTYPLDLARVIALGHSAGGQLALWAAARHRLPKSSPLYSDHPLPLRGVVALAALGDLRAFLEYEEGSCGDSVVEQLLGGSPAEVPERYAEGSPAELLPCGVEQVLVSAALDPIVPVQLGEAYQEAARRAGDPVQHVVVPGAGHHEFASPASPTWAAVLRSSRRLVGWQTP